MDSNNNIIDGYSTSTSTTSTSSTSTSTNPEVFIEKKKRGRKKMIKPEVVLSNFSNDGEATTLPEKKIRKVGPTDTEISDILDKIMPSADSV